MRLASLLGPDLKQILKEDPEQVRDLLDEIHPEDLADIISELEPDEAAALLARMPAEDAAPIFERLENDEQGEIAAQMAPESVAQIASEMSPDERADLFSSILPEAAGALVFENLQRVDPEAAEDVREIEKWPEESAGHLMTTNFVQVLPQTSVAGAIQAVRQFTEDHHDNVYNVYAVDENDKLVGVASLRTILLASPSQTFEEILVLNPITVRPDLEQREVGRRMAKYDLNVVPVLDEHAVLLGVITIDDIIDVLTAEQTEDVQRVGGMEPLDVPYFRTSFFSFIKKRGVWLIILFVEEFFTQTALRHYDPVFDAIHGAVYYVPLLISAGGNSGSQSSTLVIRGMALGEIKLSDWWRILVREAGMGLVLGIMLAVLAFGRVLMYPEQHVNFAFTIAFTLIGIVMTGCTVGSVLPLILRRFGLDPATSSTPFIASLVDVLGIIIFVHVAKVVMASVIAAHAAAPLVAP